MSQDKSYGWVDIGMGRSVYRKIEQEPIEARSDFPSPMVISDTLDQPLKSMADGKYYTSKSALRATYKPSGNPQGNSYVEVGNEVQPITAGPKIDNKKIDESLQRAMARYSAGERPNNV